MRRKLELDRKSLGEIVYATSDTPEQAEAREARLFDRALEAGERIDVERYLPSPDRIGFEEDFEIVAFDEELRRVRREWNGRQRDPSAERILRFDQPARRE